MGYALSLVLEVHQPFVREYSAEINSLRSEEECRFFGYISATLLPILEMVENLERDNIPFKIGLAMSPVICNMLNDEYLITQYTDYMEKQIEFGAKEIKRTSGSKSLNELANIFHSNNQKKLMAFNEKYKKNIIKEIDNYRLKDKIGIIASSATHSFLPFLKNNPESLQAQIAMPRSIYNQYFNSSPAGFWPPDLGWTEAIEPHLKSCNYNYAIVDSHGLLFGSPTPQKGSFYPVRTHNGIFILTRDFYAVKEIEKCAENEFFLDCTRDAGYELPLEDAQIFINAAGERRETGFKYWSRGNPENQSNRNSTNDENDTIYNPQAAAKKVLENAQIFMEKTISRLEEASKYMEETPLCLYAGDADNFGRFWHEGPLFIETLFRLADKYQNIKFTGLSEYIFEQNLSEFQTVDPEYSSWGINGYAETWLSSSNDWIYRHLARSMERMTELAERFPDETGLKERALNQAAREILLAQSNDWSGLLYRRDSTEFARAQAENTLRNFTTIYEALGSNYISTEWLTTLERRHNIFPNINYRIFKRKA